METPLDLDYWLDLQTEFGAPVRDLCLRNGHHLAVKLMTPEMSSGNHGSSIILPTDMRRKSVGNLAIIRALILRVSEPYRTKHARKEWYWDQKDPIVTPDGPIPQHKFRWKTRTGRKDVISVVQPGDCILYNSYNAAKVGVEGHDPLVIIRDIDITARYDAGVRVELGDHALR